MGVTAFIPARGGSKGIKNKNIIPFCAKPLIFWTLNALEKSNAVDRIVVATDSDKIQEAVESFALSKVEIYRRSSENASDTSPTIDVVLEYFENSDIQDFEKFLLVQATSPLLTDKDVDAFIDNFNKNSGKDSAFSCVELKRICWTADGVPINHDLKNRKRRQFIDGILIENGAMYFNTVKNIKFEKSLLSGQVLPYIMPEDTLREIDEPEDIEIVEKLLEKRIKKGQVV